MVCATAWEKFASPTVLELGDVHVIWFRLEGAADQHRQIDILSPEEQARAARFLSDVHRDRFVAGRATMRRILGSYLGQAPHAVALIRDHNGKPSLESSIPLRFNLSHSRDQAVLALAEERAVGVDLEGLRADVAIAELAQRYFSPHERQELVSLPPAIRLAAFFACWTRKEALLKATGLGLKRPLDSFDVTVRADLPPKVLRTDWDPLDAGRFTLADLPSISGFAAALAVAGAISSLRCFGLESAAT